MCMQHFFLPNPAMSNTPMKLEEDLKGKHWFTRLTTWSKRRLYTALARASRALFACSTFRGTLEGNKVGQWEMVRNWDMQVSLLNLSFFSNQPNFHVAAKLLLCWWDTFCRIVLFLLWSYCQALPSFEVGFLSRRQGIKTEIWTLTLLDSLMIL